MTKYLFKNYNSILKLNREFRCMYYYLNLKEKFSFLHPHSLTHTHTHTLTSISKPEIPFIFNRIRKSFGLLSLGETVNLPHSAFLFMGLLWMLQRHQQRPSEWSRVRNLPKSKYYFQLWPLVRRFLSNRHLWQGCMFGKRLQIMIL